MNRYRYNDVEERCKRVNRFFLLAFLIVIAVMGVYRHMAVNEGVMNGNVASISRILLIVFLIADVALYCFRKSTKLLRYLITAQVGVIFLIFIFSTPASFLGLPLIGVLGVSILYYDSKAYLFTFISYVVLYLGAQITRSYAGVVTGDANGVCQVVMTLAMFVMLFIVGKLSKLFSDHALGTVELQSSLQSEIMEVVKTESASSTDMVNNLLMASQTIAESMREISISTERFVQNITEQTHMTHNIQDAIDTTQNCSTQMVSIATSSNEDIKMNQEMMEKLKDQSLQIAQINEQVTRAMEGLQQKTKDVADIITLILKISKQTTILALNASVESVRAGDAGKGFAVVAEEIRLLAEETQKATQSITGVIEELSENAAEVVDAIQVSVTATESQNEAISVTADAFESLRGSMNQLIENTQEISTRIDNLSEANNQIVDNITHLSALSEQVSANAEQTNQLSVRNLDYAQHTRKSIQAIKESTSNLERLAQ